MLQALRAAFDRRQDSSSFEQVLQEAEAADHSSSSSSSAKGGSGSWGSVSHSKGSSGSLQQAGAGAAPGAAGTCTALLRRPAVFTLGMVWESPKVRPAATAYKAAQQQQQRHQHKTQAGCSTCTACWFIGIKHVDVVAAVHDAK
jgi:hypothetical protein